MYSFQSRSLFVLERTKRDMRVNPHQINMHMPRAVNGTKMISFLLSLMDYSKLKYTELLLWRISHGTALNILYG